MDKYLVCPYNSQEFAQTQENFARSHDRETVTFRNSGMVAFSQPVSNTVPQYTQQDGLQRPNNLLFSLLLCRESFFVPWFWLLTFVNGSNKTFKKDTQYGTTHDIPKTLWLMDCIGLLANSVKSRIGEILTAPLRAMLPYDTLSLTEELYIPSLPPPSFPLFQSARPALRPGDS